MTPTITGYALTERAAKLLKKVSPQLRNKLFLALKKLLKVPPPTGLNVEKLAGGKDIYSIRVDLHWRATFKLVGTIAHVRNFDTHDQLYRNP